MSKIDRWLFPTSTNNARMIIAQGLVSSPDGFKKYYEDALELSPGWIPLYKNEIQPDILKKGVSEREGLIPCIIEFDLSKMEGTVKALQDKRLVDVEIAHMDEDIVDKTEIMYILAPLPLFCISRILFKSNDDKNQFENDAKNRSNVILAGLKLQSTKVDKKLFETSSFNTNQSFEKLLITNSATDNSVGDLFPDCEEINYGKVYSFGGLLSSMFYFSKNGTLSNEIYHNICELKDFPESKENDIKLIYRFFEDSKNTEIKPEEKMYSGLIDIAIKNKIFKEDVIEFLESDQWDQWGEKYKKRTCDLANKLKDFERMAEKTVSEHFQEVKKPLEKILLMLFLREDIDALIEFNRDLFNEEEYIQFALMFGIRDKFSNVPKFIREFIGLQDYISGKMAIYAHRQVNSQMRFNLPRRPLTIMDMLKNDEFKKWFAKQLKIEDCFQTRMIIPTGEYELNVTNRGVEIVFEGIVKTPIAEIDEEKYFRFASTFILTEYEKYHKKYLKTT
jgi:hypothetical protein